MNTYKAGRWLRWVWLATLRDEHTLPALQTWGDVHVSEWHLLAGEGHTPVAEVDGVAGDDIQYPLVLLAGALKRSPSRVHVVEKVFRLVEKRKRFDFTDSSGHTHSTRTCLVSDD